MSAHADLVMHDAGPPGEAGGAPAPSGARDEGASPPFVTLRALVLSPDASVLIGKGGKNITELRHESGAQVHISASVPGNPERILTVSGALDSVSRAFGLVVRRVNDEPFNQPSRPGSRAYALRFVLPNARMGSVIGKGGSKLKEIQEESGARIQANEVMLPGSTERILTVSGVADAVHIAVYYLGLVLADKPDRNNAPNTPYHPATGTTAGPAFGTGTGVPPSVPGPGGGAAASLPPPPPFGPPMGAGAGGVPPLGAPGASAGAMPPVPFGVPPPRMNMSVPPPGPSQAPPTLATQTQQIYIPDDLVGSVIGKGGAKINEIRQTSGTHIKITDPSGAAERLVTITGPHPAIQIAVNMLHQRVEEERRRLQG